jgi:hypothetical protein
MIPGSVRGTDHNLSGSPAPARWRGPAAVLLPRRSRGGFMNIRGLDAPPGFDSALQVTSTRLLSSHRDCGRELVLVTQPEIRVAPGSSRSFWPGHWQCSQPGRDSSSYFTDAVPLPGLDTAIRPDGSADSDSRAGHHRRPAGVRPFLGFQLLYAKFSNRQGGVLNGQSNLKT